MNETEQTALALLAATPTIFRKLFEGIPDSILTTDLDRGWSPKRILAHMVDVENTGFSDRLRRVATEDKPALEAYDPMVTLEASGLESRPVAELLDQLERSRAETVAWLRTLTPKQLARPATHTTSGDFTLANLLHYWPSHDLAHVRGIVRMLQSVLHHETGGLDETFDV